MKPLYRNLFLLFGIAAIIFMACTFDLDFEQLRHNIRRAGLYLPAVIGVWVFVYAFNARAFQLIVNSGRTTVIFPFATPTNLRCLALPSVIPRLLALVVAPIV